jgi:putative membrane protein
MNITIAFLHHILVFTIFAVIFTEHLDLILLKKEGYSRSIIKRLSLLDAIYGVSALLILGIGFTRAFYFEKGWAYYSSNGSFHLKVTLFIILGLLSIKPTLLIRKWSKSGVNSGFVQSEVATALRYVQIELFILLGMILAAILMARF